MRNATGHRRPAFRHYLSQNSAYLQVRPARAVPLSCRSAFQHYTGQDAFFLQAGRRPAPDACASAPPSVAWQALGDQAADLSRLPPLAACAPRRCLQRRTRWRSASATQRTPARRRLTRCGPAVTAWRGRDGAAPEPPVVLAKVTQATRGLGKRCECACGWPCPPAAVQVAARRARGAAAARRLCARVGRRPARRARLARHAGLHRLPHGGGARQQHGELGPSTASNRKHSRLRMANPSGRADEIRERAPEAGPAFAIDCAMQGLAEVLCAMAPCARLYAFLGRQLALAGCGGEGHPYAEWISTYDAESYHVSVHLEAEPEDGGDGGSNPLRDGAGHHVLPPSRLAGSACAQGVHDGGGCRCAEERPR